MMLCYSPRTPEMIYFGMTGEGIVTVLTVLPILIACILLNRYIFKSADMINGTING